MASSHFSFLLLLLLPSLFFLPHPFYSIADLHKDNILLKSNIIQQINKSLDDEIPPIVYSEVTKPVKVPKTIPCICQILQHKFAHTAGKPPAIVDYSPPADCSSQEISKIVLEWTATCKGRQLDRVFGVWLSGVELLRGCTAQSVPDGIVWSVKKDITKYYSLLMKKETQKLVVYLGNIVDETYTGVYDVTITVSLYPVEEKSNDELRDRKADLILPISRSLPLNDGLWFHIHSSIDIPSKLFKIPKNVYKVLLEVYVSFHERDEFWYANLPNGYISVNKLIRTPGNGGFREVLIYLDGLLVGAVWPFTVIYNGGVNPHLWRPIVGIGSFDLPSYDIDITPFLGTMLNTKMHKISFGVTNALNVWFIDANLHLWLDHKNETTNGELLEHEYPPLDFYYKPNFQGLNGEFVTKAKRSISTTGKVQSSYGTITSHSKQDLDYINSMTLGNDGNLQTVHQSIHFNQMSSEKTPSSDPLLTESLKQFHIYLSTNNIDQGDDTSTSKSKVTLSFHDEKKRKGNDGSIAINTLENVQNAEESMVINEKGVVNKSISMNQDYSYNGVDNLCYSRRINIKNYVNIFDDEENVFCKI